MTRGFSQGVWAFPPGKKVFGSKNSIFLIFRARAVWEVLGGVCGGTQVRRTPEKTVLAC